MEEIKGAEEEDIRSLLSKIIDRDIHKTKENLKQQREHNDSFEKKFTLYFINHMIELMDKNNVLLEDLSEGTFITMVLAPILNKIFINNKKDWYVKYGETCLKAIKEENEEFSVTEISSERLVTFHGGSNENNQDAEDAHE
ncbi:13409_t:CDS:2 [Funneliformis caledonium]|uniref:13409_t:CDS:1 n=1 Tax=Funneliformis caledonium TaxID=1117310 RepID=A0A9N8VHI7_9GLOM|nr:13409_t:CDS:2 [Funneliformis caledonium]